MKSKIGAMSEENLIKAVMAVLLIVVVIAGIYLFFKDYILDFFKNIFAEEENLILGVLR